MHEVTQIPSGAANRLDTLVIGFVPIPLLAEPARLIELARFSGRMFFVWESVGPEQLERNFLVLFQFRVSPCV